MQSHADVAVDYVRNLKNQISEGNQFVKDAYKVEDAQEEFAQ